MNNQSNLHLLFFLPVLLVAVVGLLTQSTITGMQTKEYDIQKGLPLPPPPPLFQTLPDQEAPFKIPFAPEKTKIKRTIFIPKPLPKLGPLFDEKPTKDGKSTKPKDKEEAGSCVCSGIVSEKYKCTYQKFEDSWNCKKTFDKHPLRKKCQKDSDCKEDCNTFLEKTANIKNSCVNPPNVKKPQELPRSPWKCTITKERSVDKRKPECIFSNP